MSGQMRKYLVFEVEEEYALALDSVVEIIEHKEITPVPDTPDYVSGILNLRGHVIPVIDIRLRFRKTQQPGEQRRCIVIANVQDSKLGMIVDNVVDLIDIDDDHLSDVPQVGSNYIHAFVKYIGVTDNKMHLILDTDRLVDYNEMGAWSQGTEGAEA